MFLHQRLTQELGISPNSHYSRTLQDSGDQIQTPTLRGLYKYLGITSRCLRQTSHARIGDQFQLLFYPGLSRYFGAKSKYLRHPESDRYLGIKSKYQPSPE